MNKTYVLLGICAMCITLSLQHLAAQNVKVFILAGQSNMQGHGNIYPIDVNGTLANFMANDETGEFAYLQNSDGTWATRNDVWVRYDHDNGNLLNGDLGVGYGGYEGQIGPELGFGHLLGEYCEEQVLLIKTCWGGKNLAVDFRPPSSGGTVGPYYNQMITDISTALENITEEFPQFDGGEVEIAGFCWFQGWNDGEEEAYLMEYEQNLKNLIADVRTDLNVPNLPFVVGLTGNGGYEINESDFWIYQLQTILVPAQINAAQSADHINVAYAETRDFWRAGDLSPEPFALHHWNNNAESYFRIGNALGTTMIDMLDQITGTPNVSHEHPIINVFPCPANNYFRVQGEVHNYTLRIYDVNGQVVQSFEQIPLTSVVDITAFVKGVYFIEILNTKSQKVLVKKIFKQ